MNPQAFALQYWRLDPEWNPGAGGSMRTTHGPPDSKHDSRATSRAAERPRPLVLVVEDEENDWEIYGKILWYNGFDVAYAAEGEEGLRLARERRPALVLLDMMLPGMDGLELCRRIKEDPALERTPIVMLTARSAHDIGAQARAAGCTAFLEKPHSPVKLLHRVEDLVGRPPLSGEGRPPELVGAN
jgi:two-component system, cell cycle response regulator DivK